MALGLRILALDPELAEDLPSDVLPRAIADVVAPELQVRTGPWEVERIPLARRSPLGVLVLSGVFARDVGLAGHSCSELLGVGDILDPWEGGRRETLLATSKTWTVLEPGRLALLDPDFVRAASAYPELMMALWERGNRRCERLGLHHAIAQLPRVELRLLALFWHLAERWGRIGRDGVVLPLALPHHMLGRLVGARRPTVSLAMRELADRGHVRRREDGAWQLARSAPGMLEAVQGVQAPRGALVPAPRSESLGPVPARDLDAVDQMAAQLFLRVRRARQLQADQLPSQQVRFEDLRERSAEIRRRSAALREELAARRTA